MTDEHREQLLADCLEDFHRRRAMGEKPQPVDYRERLGDDYDEFLGVLAAESALTELIEQDSEGGLPRVFGDYTLLRVLGRGAMGVVYEAVHRPLGRKVAVKVLRTGFDTEPEALERFRREARACAQVKHDHIVEIYEAGEAEGRPYYAMELLDGQSLSDLIRSGSVPGPEELAAGLAEVADALEAMHRAGLVHRDVKPGNILVQADGRMILADFGLARSIASDRLTQTGQVLGTPLYMSPEQFLARRQEIDQRTDVYGLGISMYEALAGVPPFSAPDSLALMRMILHERPEHLADAAPDVPLPLTRVAMKSIENRKEDRYPTAAAMRDDLRAFVEGRPVAGRPVTRRLLLLRKVRRRLPAAAAALVLLALGLSFWSRRDGEMTVTSVPVGEVYLDGEYVGTTELRRPISPGPHEIRVTRRGYREERRDMRVAAGQAVLVLANLVIEDPEDAEALTVLGDSLGLDLGPMPAPERLRGGGEPKEVRILLPRGRVRGEDLREIVVDGPADLLEAGDEIRLVADGETLASFPLPERLREPIPVPESAIAGLSPGRELRVEYVSPENGILASEDLLLVAGPAERLAELEAPLEDQPEALRRIVAGRLFLEEGLPVAARAEARALLAPNPDSLRATEIEIEALSALGLKDSALYADAVNRYRRLTR